MSIRNLTNSIFYDIVTETLAESRNITCEEAKAVISKMTFLEYHELFEAIVPPSGNTIGSQGSSASPQQQNKSAPQPSDAKSTWTGKGPVQVGMTVGIKGPGNAPVPGAVSRVDAATNGVVIKDPTTGKEQTFNMADLQPFVAQANAAGQNITPGATNQQTQEESQIRRLRELAGIKEMCSGGATGAGAIAIAPAAVGSVKRRQPTDEKLSKEYTRKEAPKTIIGDTKPSQASGELSANLAASGKKSAGRTNNGFKK